MRLTESNIKFVKESTCNGLIYAYYVLMKDFELISYINHENNRTVVKEYKEEWLPKTIQNYISKHTKQIFLEMEDKDKKNYYIQYIYINKEGEKKIYELYY